MANLEQVKVLEKGVETWNKWKKRHSSVKTNLGKASLSGAYLAGADLRNANLREADLEGANLLDANLEQANLVDAKLAGANLVGANLREASLTGADLRYARLFQADLKRARLVGADFRRSILIEANLSEANLREANLRQADLHKANLQKANLISVNLSLSKLFEVDFREAELGNTIFGFNNLGYSLGLEQIRHFSSSVVDSITIRLSKGRIPTLFLRGCGLSDLDIEYAKLANPGLDPEQVTDITYRIHTLYLGGGIKFYSCFISYNNKDQEFAKHLHDDLQNSGVRCWFAPDDIKIGERIRPTIDRQIRLRDKLLVILSENSVKSEWVGDEVEAAFEEEQKDNRLVLFPIRLDDAVMSTRDDWVAKIKRRRHIGDFSNWKEKSSYHKSFERLLRDLKATDDRSVAEEY